MFIQIAQLTIGFQTLAWSESGDHLGSNPTYAGWDLLWVSSINYQTRPNHLVKHPGATMAGVSFSAVVASPHTTVLCRVHTHLKRESSRWRSHKSFASRCHAHLVGPAPDPCPKLQSPVLPAITTRSSDLFGDFEAFVHPSLCSFPNAI
jgi:hypothetical protein